MNVFDPESIKQEHMDKLMPLWLNYQTLQPKLSKTSKGAAILLDWMTSIVEYKVKKATFSSLKKSENEVTSIDFAALLNDVSTIDSLAAQRAGKSDSREKFDDTGLGRKTQSSEFFFAIESY